MFADDEMQLELEHSNTAHTGLSAAVKAGSDTDTAPVTPPHTDLTCTPLQLLGRSVSNVHILCDASECRACSQKAQAQAQFASAQCSPTYHSDSTWPGPNADQLRTFWPRTSSEPCLFLGDSAPLHMPCGDASTAYCPLAGMSGHARPPPATSTAAPPMMGAFLDAGATALHHPRPRSCTQLSVLPEQFIAPFPASQHSAGVGGPFKGGGPLKGGVYHAQNGSLRKVRSEMTLVDCNGAGDVSAPRVSAGCLSDQLEGSHARLSPETTHSECKVDMESSSMCASAPSARSPRNVTARQGNDGTSRARELAVHAVATCSHQGPRSPSAACPVNAVRDWICELEYQPRTNLLLSAHARKAVAMYRIDPCCDLYRHIAPAHRFHAAAKVSCAEWSPWQDEVVNIGDCDGVISCVDVCSGHVLTEIDEHDGYTIRVVTSSQLRRGVTATAGDDGVVRLWGAGSNSDGDHLALGSATRGAPVYAAAWSPNDENVLVTGNGNGEISLWDVRQPDRALAAWLAHSRACCSLAISGSSQIVSAGVDGLVKVWDSSKAMTHQGPSVCELSGHANARNMLDMALSPEGLIAIGSESNYVHVFDAAGHLCAQVPGLHDTSYVTSVEWLPASQGADWPLLAAASTDGAVNVLRAQPVYC